MDKKRVANLAGKVAVITGGGSGLGAAFSRALAADGARVVVADIRGDLAAEMAAEIGAEGAAIDVSNPEQIESLLQATKSKYGSLDLVINNAGILAGGEPSEIRLDDWQRVLQVNLMGVVAGSLAAVKIMMEQRSGQILNMGSICGLSLAPLLGPYSASKAGVVFFSRGLAEEVKAWGINVAVACPGNIQTAILPSHVGSMTTPLDPDYSAQRILRQMRRGKRIIVFPMYANLWWWLDRLSPELLGPLREVIIKRARARAAAARHSE